MTAPPAPRSAETPGWVRACRRVVLDRPVLVPVIVAGRQILLLRDGDGVFATDRACPHEGADLTLGRCAAGRLHCPRHQASFDLTTETVSPGWAFPPLRTYGVRIVGAEIFVDAGGSAFDARHAQSDTDRGAAIDEAPATRLGTAIFDCR